MDSIASQPSDAAFAAAAKIGRQFARDMRTPWVEQDDYAQEARIALVNEWPILLERYPDGFMYATLRTVLRHRLHDYRRRDRHRVGRTKDLQPSPLPLDTFYDTSDRTVRVEDEALDSIGVLTINGGLIQRLVAPLPPHKRRQFSQLCRWLAKGHTLKESGGSLGVTESRASQMVKELRSLSSYEPCRERAPKVRKSRTRP